MDNIGEIKKQLRADCISRDKKEVKMVQKGQLLAQIEQIQKSKEAEIETCELDLTWI